MDTLDSRLRSDDTSQAAAAAWEVLHLAERFADAMAWETGVDTVQALAAAHSCGEARRYLAVPVAGRSAHLPAAEPADLARLLAYLTTDADRLLDSAARHQAAAAQQAFSALAGTWRTTP
ncbi:hypothetical protein BEN35_19060 [Streptomyces fradiae]|nr:hypothetical protein BEN35_19060 [Streptomyces fradiae]